MLRSIRIHASTILLSILLGSDAKAADRETQASATQPGAAAEYRMLDQGAEPHRLLRFEPKVGQRAIMKWTTESESVREIDGVVSEGKPLPLSSIEIGMEVTHVANGEITQRIEFLRFGTGGTEREQADAAADAMQTAFAGLKGKVGEIVIDTRGRFVRGGFDASQFNASTQPVIQQLNQRFRATSIVLPTEPVGIGAQWEVVQEAIGATTKSNVRATYRIKAIEGSVITLDMDSSLKGKPLSDTSSILETDAQTHGVMTFDLRDASRFAASMTTTLVILQERAATQPATKVKIKVKNTDRITMTLSTAPWPPSDDAGLGEKQPRE